jgi:hypothetical protein
LDAVCSALTDEAAVTVAEAEDAVLVQVTTAVEPLATDGAGTMSGTEAI